MYPYPFAWLILLCSIIAVSFQSSADATTAGMIFSNSNGSIATSSMIVGGMDMLKTMQQLQSDLAAMTSQTTALQSLVSSQSLMIAQVNSSLQQQLRQISTNTTLTSDDFGKKIIGIGSSPYIIMLPTSAVAQSFIEFNVLTSSYALVTIKPAAGTIMSQSQFILGKGESCRVYSDGSNWWVENLVLMPVSFLVSCQSCVSSIPANTPFRIPYNWVAFDDASFFSTSPSRYQPRYPGKYAISAAFVVSSTGSGGVTGEILMNGNVIMQDIVVTGQGTNSVRSAITLYLNGESDYVEYWVVQSGNSVPYDDGAAIYFTAHRISNF